MSNLAVRPTRSFLCGSGSRIVIMNSLPSKQVQVHINGECMISCRATHMLGALQFRRKKIGRRKQYQAMGKWPKSRASLSENVISRPSRDRPNKDGLAHLEEALASSKYCKEKSTLKGRNNCIQDTIERTIFNCRFLTLMAVAGSLAGSVLCFIKGLQYMSSGTDRLFAPTGCFLVLQSFSEYFGAFWQRLDFGQIIVLLVEAIDVYLMGTVMLIFGMGLYELFISSLQEPSYQSSQGLQREPVYGSNLFGLFHLRKRPLWLEIHSLEELKTKIGHVIVMILLVSLFEKSKRVAINTGLDMICFSVSILLSSASIFLLSRLSVK